MLGGCDSGGARICLRKEQKEARGRDSAPVQSMPQSGSYCSSLALQAGALMLSYLGHRHRLPVAKACAFPGPVSRGHDISAGCDVGHRVRTT